MPAGIFPGGGGGGNFPGGGGGGWVGGAFVRGGSIFPEAILLEAFFPGAIFRTSYTVYIEQLNENTLVLDSCHYLLSV